MTSPSSSENAWLSAFGTEGAVYGNILVSGMIVVAGTHGATAWNVLITVIGTVLVFWAAHVYAGTLSMHVADDGDPHPLSHSFRLALRRSVGMLVAALLPSLVLLLGTFKIIDDQLALWVALWLGVVVLGAIGYLVYARRGSSMAVRLLGSLSSAGFGIVMVLLKAFVH